MSILCNHICCPKITTHRFAVTPFNCICSTGFQLNIHWSYCEFVCISCVKNTLFFNAIWCRKQSTFRDPILLITHSFQMKIIQTLLHAIGKCIFANEKTNSYRIFLRTYLTIKQYCLSETVTRTNRDLVLWRTIFITKVRSTSSDMCMVYDDVSGMMYP